MLSSLLSILSTLVMIGFIIGNLANGFIALVSCIDWFKRPTFSLVDQILTSLAVSRIGLLWITLMNWYATAFNPVLYCLEVRIIVHIMWTVTNHFNLWFATSLSIFYLLKLANFSSFKFLYLKWRLKSVIYTILLGSFIFLVSQLLMVSMEESMTTRKEYEGNTTSNVVHLSSIAIFTVANFLPFTMSLIALLLLIFFLWRHHKNMQLRIRGSQDPGTRVHIRVMQTVVSFLVSFACYILSLLFSVWSSTNIQNKQMALVCQIFGILYPSGHSCVLIWGNRKLRQAFLSFLQQVGCWLKVRKGAGAPLSSCGKHSDGV